MPMTLIFSPDPREYPHNPFDIETPLGKPVTIARGDLAEENDRLREKLAEVRAHMGACVMQRAACDDAIIFEHIEAALAAARE